LVLYEVFTGRRAFPEKDPDELTRLYEAYKPSSVSDLVPNIDPRISKVIRQCLEIDTALRPPSAQAVAASLPKADPLAKALAEGRTPSPENVANAPEKGSLAPSVAMALLTAVVLGVVLIAALAPRATISGLMPMTRSPDALAARARTIFDRMGCTDLPADYRYGYFYDYDYLDHTVGADATRQRWSALVTGRVPAIVFWFRQSQQFLIAEGMSPRLYPGRVTPLDPAVSLPWSASVELDPNGRLIEFIRVPDRQTASPPDANEIDFQPFFAEAKLDWSRAKETTPSFAPPFFAERQFAWESPPPDGAGEPLRVEAATHNSQVAYFKVYHGVWEQPDSLRHPLEIGPGPFHYIYAGLFFLTIFGAAVLARQNLRLGLGDMTGATRLALFLFACHLVCMALVADHVPSFRDEATWLMKAIGFAALWSGLCWLVYYALEPYVRRYWPWRMISWNRLLVGRFRDPMVGRDVLIGAVLGTFMALALQLGVIVPPLFGYASPVPLVTWPTAYTNVPFHLLMEIPVAIRDALQWYFVLFLFVLLVRRTWLAAALVFALHLAFNLTQEPEVNLFWATAMGAAVLASLYVTLRYGLLAYTVGLFFCYFLYQVPLTLDPSSWFWWQSVIYMCWPIFLAAVGFAIARAPRPAFQEIA
jgi:serine/threonine-protein kinase